MVHITLSVMAAVCTATPGWRGELKIDSANDSIGPNGNPSEPRFGWRPDLDPIPDLSPSTSRPSESLADPAPEPREAEPPPAGEELITEPVVGDESNPEPISEPTAGGEPVPDVSGEPSPGGELYWEPPKAGSQQSDLDGLDSRYRQTEGPVRWFGVQPVMVYGLLLVLFFAGTLGFGLWMRDQQASPASLTARAPASSAAGGSQLAVGGGVGVPDVTGKTVQVTVGETVYLGLQVDREHQSWKVSSPDPAVLTPVKSPMDPTPGMTMLVFKAVGVGQTVITATRQGDCPTGQQCPDTTRRFEETVVVVPG